MSRPETLGPALDAVRALPASPTGRLLVGIAGPPGAGKSTLAAALVKVLRRELGNPESPGGGHAAVVVGMDGFHLANTELRRLGLEDRKGSPPTFDAAGFVHLLRRLRTPGPGIVYAPAYSRVLHESIGGAIPVHPGVRIVVVEGNYLLFDEGPWAEVRGLLDTVLYLDAPERTRREALVRRQLGRGLEHDAAYAWVENSDEVNARLIAGTRDRADLVLRRS